MDIAREMAMVPGVGEIREIRRDIGILTSFLQRRVKKFGFLTFRPLIKIVHIKLPYVID